MREQITVKGHQVALMYLSEVKMNFSKDAAQKAQKLFGEAPKGMKIIGIAKRNTLESAILEHQSEGNEKGGLLLGFQGKMFAALSIA